MRLPRAFEDSIPVAMSAFETESEPAQPWKALDCPTREQEETEWCWAACGQAVRRFHRPAETVEQCEVARRVKGKVCCGFERSICNKADVLAIALFKMDHLREPIVFGTMDFDDIYDDISAADPHPIGCFIDYADNKLDHFVLIIAAGVVAGRQCVGVVDPLKGREHTTPVEIEYSAFKGYQKGTWAESYRTKRA